MIERVHQKCCAFILLVACCVSTVRADQPKGKLRRGLATGSVTISSGHDLAHVGPCIAFQPGQINVAFALVRRPKQKYEFIYFVIYKDPDDMDDATPEVMSSGRSGSRGVDIKHSLQGGGQKLDTTYRFTINRGAGKLVDESVTVGKRTLMGSPKVFLADFSAKPFNLRELQLDLLGLAPQPVAGDEKSSDKIADEIFALIDRLAKQSTEVRKFLDGN